VTPILQVYEEVLKWLHLDHPRPIDMFWLGSVFATAVIFGILVLYLRTSHSKRYQWPTPDSLAMHYIETGKEWGDENNPTRKIPHYERVRARSRVKRHQR